MTIQATPYGPRFYVVGQRVHHGALGSVMVLVGLLLTIHDRSDWRRWFKAEHR